MSDERFRFTVMSVGTDDKRSVIRLFDTKTRMVLTAGIDATDAFKLAERGVPVTTNVYDSRRHHRGAK